VLYSSSYPKNSMACAIGEDGDAIGQVASSMGGQRLGGYDGRALRDCDSCEAAIPVRLRWKGGGTIGEGDGREGGCDGRVAA
jgi:hypothetical protein